MKVVTTALLVKIIVTYVTALTTSELADRNSLFTSAVYKEAAKSGGGNLLISPFSAGIVLALTQSGAKGGTGEEIRSGLQLPQNQEEIKSGFKNLLEKFESGDEFTLHTANKIYVGGNLPIREDFKRAATDSYQAEVENVDFSRSLEATNKINQWVEGKTEHKIKDLVDPSVINSGTPALIVNTLYFKARWEDNDWYKFPISKRDFHKTKTDVVKIDTMSQFGAFFNFYEDTNLKARFLELPLKGEGNHMVIVLPTELDGLADLEKQPEKIFKKHNFTRKVVDVALPLFKVESQINFKPILTKLGMKKAFISSEADFSGIGGGKGALAIEGVLQKTFISVDQSGVEAAAATDLWFYTSGPPRATVEFKVDHPFIFYLQVKGVILFAGKVSDPKY